MKVQLDENAQILKTINRNQEVSIAKLENIELTAAKSESIQKMQREVNFLGSKVYDLALSK